MTEKRYYCDEVNENRDYAIFDLSKSPKTKEDFWNEDEEYYELWRFHIYLMDETDAMMNSKEVEELLNKQNQEIQQIKSIMDNELKNAFNNRINHDDYAGDPECAEYFKGYHCGVSDLTKKIMEVLFK